MVIGKENRDKSRAHLLAILFFFFKEIDFDFLNHKREIVHQLVLFVETKLLLANGVFRVKYWIIMSLPNATWHRIDDKKLKKAI